MKPQSYCRCPGSQLSRMNMLNRWFSRRECSHVPNPVRDRTSGSRANLRLNNSSTQTDTHATARSPLTKGFR